MTKRTLAEVKSSITAWHEDALAVAEDSGMDEEELEEAREYGPEIVNELIEAAQAEYREALTELLAVATSEEWKGAFMYASIHGYRGTPKGLERSVAAFKRVTELLK